MIRITMAFACLFFLSTDASAKKRRSAVATEAGFQIFGPVAVARQFVGTNPTDMNNRWCGRFIRLVLKRAGFGDPGPEYDAARSFAKIGRPIGLGGTAIAVWPHHVGLIVRPTRPGYAIVISGNDGPRGSRTVMERERSLAGAKIRYI